MKVTVYQGRNFVTTNEFVLAQAAKQPNLTPVWVIVPDRFTLQAEKIMLQQHAHLVNARVVTFSMLYQIVASELNQGLLPEIVDKTTAVLQLWNAIKQVQDQLLWFKKSVTHYDFAEKMFNTLNQIRSSRVDFNTLEKQAASPVARKKYHDINLIYQAYIQNVKVDAAGMLEYLIANLARSQVLRQTSVYLCGFAALSPARLQILDIICHNAAQVTIAASQPEILRQLSKYQCYQIKTTAFTPQLRTARCLTERSEANIVAQKIVALLEQGVNPENIVVLLTEFDTLAPVWQVVFDDYQIPINLDVGTKLSALPEAQYLFDLLELAINDHAENTVAVLFNSCSGITDADAAMLENKIIKSDLRARYVPEIKKLTAITTVASLCDQLKQLTTNEKLQQILDKIAQCQGTQKVQLREFSNLLRTLCAATKVSQIPQYLNRVLIAPVNDWVPSQVQHLFIANCTAENFPQGQADDDILQEADLVATAITPTPSLQRWRNYHHAQLLQTVATDTTYLSGTNEDFQDVAYQPSSSFTLPNDQKPISVGRDLFFPHQHVKTTMLEQFYSCPHLNFIQNGLRLRPREIYQLKPNLVGTAIHQALQVYFETHHLEAAVAAGTKALTYDCPPLVQNLGKEIRFIIKQLETIFATGKFRVHSLETEIKKPLDNGLVLVGRVDRVDVAPLAEHQNAVLVLDYKTGNVNGSLAKSIYLGNKLQLPIYASALASLGPIAGAGYLPLCGGYAVDRQDLTLKGLVAADFTALFPPTLLNPRGQQIVSPEILERICQHANDLVAQAVKRLLEGEVAARAVDKSVCQYCPVRTLCAQAQTNCRGDGVRGTFKSFFGGTAQ